jgi:polysaccharide deacetylase family protein (PEP-CTERM system associated)
MTPPAERQHILTVALEDYFQVGAFNRFVQRNQWYRFETRLEQNTDRVLALLAAHGAKATFFALGWVAAKFPELLRAVAVAGHEVAVKGYYHRGIHDMTPEEFEADAARAKAAAEAATGRPVRGYRLADGWLKPDELWALDRLAALGFRYDSSIAQVGGLFADQPHRATVHEHATGLVEVPISTAKVFGVRIPVAGGNYLRQLPEFLTRRAAARWVRTHTEPLVAYFHAWELDPEQPRLSVGGSLTRLRHYRNLHRMEERLGRLLARYRFTTAADYLNIPTEPAATAFTPPPRTEHDTDRIVVSPLSLADRAPVSVVVPCFNEEDVLPYLTRTLDRVAGALADRYDLRFILVDDGSTDRTWDALNAAFAGRSNFALVKHDVNQGVSAAIMTGIRHADTDVVCSMDCDCTYDPLELGNMIPRLTPGVDLVTASPYHPQGAVRNVPAWRLVLSKGASWLYRRVLRQKLHTYTSCFRVYRKSSVEKLNVENGRFLGVAELAGRLDLAGGVIVEHPATLEVRMLGRSKIKTVRTVLGHVKLMAKLLAIRMRAARSPLAAPRKPVVDDARLSLTSPLEGEVGEVLRAGWGVSDREAEVSDAARVASPHRASIYPPPAVAEDGRGDLPLKGGGQKQDAPTISD